MFVYICACLYVTITNEIQMVMISRGRKRAGTWEGLEGEREVER